MIVEKRLGLGIGRLGKVFWERRYLRQGMRDIFGVQVLIRVKVQRYKIGREEEVIILVYSLRFGDGREKSRSYGSGVGGFILQILQRVFLGFIIGEKVVSFFCWIEYRVLRDKVTCSLFYMANLNSYFIFFFKLKILDRKII